MLLQRVGESRKAVEIETDLDHDATPGDDLHVGLHLVDADVADLAPQDLLPPAPRAAAEMRRRDHDTPDQRRDEDRGEEQPDQHGPPDQHGGLEDVAGKQPLIPGGERVSGGEYGEGDRRGHAITGRVSQQLAAVEQVLRACLPSAHNPARPPFQQRLFETGRRNVHCAYRTVNSPRRRMSFDDEPIMTRKTPGSTIHFRLRSSRRRSSGPRVNRTSFDSPGASGTRAKPFSSITGRATDASTSRT